MPDRVDIGLPAPKYVSQTIDGDSVSLATMQDKVVLLNVVPSLPHRNPGAARHPRALQGQGARARRRQRRRGRE
jgi:hypothetical protein